MKAAPKVSRPDDSIRIRLVNKHWHLLHFCLQIFRTWREKQPIPAELAEQGRGLDILFDELQEALAADWKSDIVLNLAEGEYWLLTTTVLRIADTQFKDGTPASREVVAGLLRSLALQAPHDLGKAILRLQRRRLIARWAIGTVSFCMVCLCLTYTKMNPFLDSVDSYPNHLAALVWFAIGSVSYYSALRWLWRKLL